eukprot:GHVR01035044.1.p1 GENE.GHVR01035044.1~~GHVR01035044.1.p1  ORF type:complete len:214 (-),score=15.47 GHVR01035044.1:156-797(-)
MKFVAIISLVPSYVIAQNIFCIYKEEITNGLYNTKNCTAKISPACARSVDCASLSDKISARFDGDAYYLYNSVNCVPSTKDVAKAVIDPTKTCNFFGAYYSVQEETAPTGDICYYTQSGCNAVDQVSCPATIGTCIKYGDNKYAKVEDFVAQVYSDPNCTTKIQNSNVRTNSGVFTSGACTNVYNSELYIKSNSLFTSLSYFTSLVVMIAFLK